MTEPTPIQILVVDDQAMVRESLSNSLGMAGDFRVVATAAKAEDGIRATLKVNPDVILMDIDMPGLICFDAVRRLLPLRPESKIIILSTFLHDSYLEQAIASGARGYVLKVEGLAVLFEAIRKVAAGGFFFSELVWERLTLTAKGMELNKDSVSRLSTLSPRELEVLRYVASGLSKKEIASIMHLSGKTVDGHTVRLMSKLDIHDRVELTRFAIGEGLIKV